METSQVNDTTFWRGSLRNLLKREIFNYDMLVILLDDLVRVLVQSMLLQFARERDVFIFDIRISFGVDGV